jgi:LCP family protein required for cell wall assembly
MPTAAAVPVSPTAPTVPLAEHKDYPLPAYYPAQHPERIVRGGRRKHARKRVSRRGLVLRGAALSFVLMATLGGLLAWNGYVKVHKVFRGTSMVAALAAKPVAPQALKGEGDGRVNILLLGIGGEGHDGPDLTDTIMLLSVDPVNNTAALLSIPRDLWVDQPIPYLSKQGKINSVYESGKYHYLGQEDSSNDNAAAVEAGFANLDQVVEKVTGVDINYHVLINFQAFKQAIDTVGGVTVNVPTPLVDPTMAWENGNNPVLAAAGTQHMNGTQALLYARSRETTSDFARGQRQRQILVALKDKVLTAGTLSNPAKLESLINAFGDNVYSDMSTQGAERLYTIMKKIGDGNINSIDLTDPPHQLITTGRVGSSSVDLPVAGQGNYSDIQSYVRSQLPDGYIVKENAPITVLGQTADGAAVTGTLLKSYGYNVTATLATDQPVQQLTLVDLSDGQDPYTLHYLENRYGVKAVTALPSGTTVAPGSAKFVILEP